jgi:diguanylate cyclase (GGDEF)-like protein
MKIAVERRIPLESGLAGKLAWPLRLSPADAWKVVLAGLWLTALADVATGQELWMGPLYLLVISLAAWSLGWIEAVAIGFASLAITVAANGTDLYPGTGAAGVWNIAVRVVAVLILIGLLHTARQMYTREWRLSRTDPLTGALNRKAFFELTAVRRSSRGWSLLLYCDLDGFKSLNDTSGHAAGDACLAHFAQGIAKAIRKNDVFARVGGDEFAIYLDLKDEAAARAVASRIHATMNGLLADTPGVQCSLGGLILTPGRRSIDAEIRAADALMYEAKSIGASLVVATANQRGRVLVVERHCTPAVVSIGQATPPIRIQPQDAVNSVRLEEVA